MQNRHTLYKLILLILLLPVVAGSQVINQFNPLRQGLIAWYPVVSQLAGGSVWYDIVSRLNCTISGVPLWSSDPSGRFAGLLGYDNSQTCTVGDVAPLSFTRTSQFSFVIWIWNLNATSTLMSKYNAAGDDGYWFGLYTAGGLAFFMGEVGGSSWDVESSQHINDGLAHQCVVTYNGNSSDTGALLYIDGVLAALANPTPGTLTGSIAVSDPFIIGEAGATVGRLGNAMVYNRVLSASEIQALYSMQAPIYSGLVIDEPFAALKSIVRRTPRKVVFE